MPSPLASAPICERHDCDRTADARSQRCPICGKPRSEQFRPFCSKRCADVDLNRWLTGVYAVPGKEEEDEDGDARRAGRTTGA